jgi:transposase
VCRPEIRFVVDMSNEGTLQMIVIGSDPHKRSHTAAAVGAATGELQGSETVQATTAGLERMLAWGRSLDPERVWAIEDCRHVSGRLERFLIARGERVVRVPPKLMAGRRRASRERGKSDPIDALSVARAALAACSKRFPSPRSMTSAAALRAARSPDCPLIGSTLKLCAETAPYKTVSRTMSPTQQI